MFPIALAALTAVSTLIAAPQGHWIAYTPQQLPRPGGELIRQLASDSQGSVYLLAGPSGLRYDGSLFVPFPLASKPANRFLIRGPNEYWQYDSHLSPVGVIGSLIHISGGLQVPNPGCLSGNDFRILGLDAQGRLVIDSRMNHGLGSYQPGLLRLSAAGCDTIRIGIPPHSEQGAVAYVRDSLGREYFATELISDLSACGPVVRLDRGRVDTLIENTCATGMAVSGNQAVVAGPNGLWITTETGSRKIPSINQTPIASAHAPFRDSRGILWLGGSFDGVLSIDGGDSVFHSRSNSEYGGATVVAFAEDAERNVWALAEAGKVSIFARGRVTVATAPGRHPPMRVPMRVPIRVDDRDAAGRSIRPGTASPSFRIGP